MITVFYESIDGARQRRTFKTPEGARKFAVLKVGEHPEVGTGYAVSGDGVGKVTVEGCTIAALFAKPAGADLVALESADPWAPVEYAPRAECEQVIVDADSDETGIHYHWGWFRKSALARHEAENKAHRETVITAGAIADDFPF